MGASEMDETRNTEKLQEASEGAVRDLHERTGGAAPGDTAPGDTEGAQPESAQPAGPSVEELQDRWRRAVAELDNQRKRYERQLEQIRRAERDRVTAAWLPIVDNLELALQHAQADPAAIVAGVQAVHDQALDVLLGLGYRRVEDIGARFDPALHEAAQVVREPDAEPNTVVAVLRPGYTADGGLLRPAVVAVAARREPAGEDQTEQARQE